MKDAKRMNRREFSPGGGIAKPAADDRAESADRRVERLEEKISYLERHVVEQDKAMLEMAEELAALRRAVNLLRETEAARRHAAPDSAGDAADDRPPHY